MCFVLYIFWVFDCLYDTERSVKSSTFTTCRRSFPTQNKWHHPFCVEYFVGERIVISVTAVYWQHMA